VLSQALKSELQGEIARLRARRDAILSRIDAKIEAMESLLVDEDEDSPEPAAPAAPKPKVLTPVQRSLADVSTKGPVRYFELKQGEGFRAILRRFITEHPNVTNREISDALEAAGYTAGGTLPLRTRVQLETRRLASEKLLTKTAEGRMSMGAS
jgi:hypothetical protein